jgi:tetratricopeptide (TPR) repeat protein
MSTWLDQADHWLGTHDLADQGSVTDALSEQSRALASPMMGKGGEVTTSLEAPAIEGPAHVPDDQSTGVGYHAWLVRGLSPDSREAEATRRLALDPEDGESRRVLARTRYDQEHFAESARHYRQLLLRYPGDRPARLRLAWAFKRQGRHLEELAQYRALVREDARDVFALGGGGVALVRLGRLDDAQVLFERLEVVAPDSAHTAWTSALFAASEGKNDEALEFVDHFFEKRGELPSEIKLEFCRDLALDPLLAPLRRDPRLRFLLLRHLGPASPRAL